jgi:hypothetical protein
MTRLVKQVRREVGDIGLRGGDAGEFIVTLLPPHLLEFRKKGCRRRFTVTLASCYVLAARIAAEQIRKERAAQRRAKATKKCGMR